MKKLFTFLFVGILISGTVVVSLAVAQEKYPSKPITLIVPYAPGGSHDLVARALQTQMEKILGVSVLVENKPGGGTTIGCNIVKSAPPNGYLFGTVSPTFSIIKYTLPDSKMSYDQFEPIAFVGYSPQGFFTRADAPWKNLKEVMDYAKANPGKLRVGNGGHGGNFHLGAIGIEQAAGVKFTHVPFKGAAPAIPAVMGGHVDVIISTIADTLHMVKGGSLKVLGLAAPEKNKFAPGAQIFKDLGIDAEYLTYWAYMGPKGMPKDRVKILYEALKKGMETKEVADFFEMQGATYSMKSPEELATFWKKEDQTYAKITKLVGAAP